MTGADSAEPAAGKRCFLALLPAPAPLRILARCREKLQRSLTGAPRGARWLEPETLHLTLRFLGESTQAQIEYLDHMLPTLAAELAPLATRRFGVWPNRARPRLLVLELDVSPILSELVDRCEQQALKAGFAADPRRFRPHITLARLRPGCAFGNLSGPPPTIAFDAIALMQSSLARPAATYRELARTPLHGRLG
ncbi:MAG: RNA 2',3'-cyclic phosphodiesterase [Rhodanobacteraceae bacterium]